MCIWVSIGQLDNLVLQKGHHSINIAIHVIGTEWMHPYSLRLSQLRLKDKNQEKDIIQPLRDCCLPKADQIS